uniref:Uncharacterized protein n=2 Tax=unclassified Caudoviricetes TaxID=2788787 RepID=A0A8S5QAU6_9CAUD|nr:MAG TPA: hypothetical protein [Siphoviridae sp. ctet217]DAE15921.1 MAG TPA: hypothetical protein [Siphoviridae sp. ctfR912]DAR96209.1 MAG TPA: hypothetical protein [Caudoviricetes sp.]DAS36406.1 MAG TPA: hypothetical protein [Caudoviricetes sp.]
MSFLFPPAYNTIKATTIIIIICFILISSF